MGWGGGGVGGVGGLVTSRSPPVYVLLWVPDVLVFFSGLGFGGWGRGVREVSNVALVSA